ncbi:CHAT domain-containing protein, partial [Nonomuraea sp. MG754425]|nr:CHAT domain-containing protein [Nonomuraea sp. MG754425]
PDEAMHITTAFQLAGFQQVIGTLWPVNDTIAARVAEGVYAGLGGDRVVDRPERPDHLLEPGELEGRGDVHRLVR